MSRVNFFEIFSKITGVFELDLIIGNSKLNQSVKDPGKTPRPSR